MDTNKLKSKRIIYGDTLKQAGQAINVNLTSYSKREKGILPFMVPEIIKLAKRYKLTNDDIIEIFFDELVHSKETTI